MSLVRTAFVAANFGTAALLVGLGVWIRRRRAGTTATVFVALLACSALWTTIVGLRVLVAWEWKLALFHLENLAWWAVPILWLVFTLYYTGREYLLTPRWTGVLGVTYLVPATLMAVNPGGVFWAGFERHPEPFVNLNVAVTGWYYPVLVGMYVLILVGFALVVKMLVTARRGSRAQLGLIALAPASPVGLHLAGLQGILPGDLEYVAIGSGLFALVVGVVLFRHELFAVEPLARDAVIEATRDGIVVTDADRRVVDFNEAAAAAFPDLEGGFGTPLEDLAGELVDGTGTGADQFVRELTIATGERPRTYDVAVSPLRRGGSVRGYVLSIRDVTEREDYARRLERQTEQLDQFASTISHDLRNPLSIATGVTYQIMEAEDPSMAEQVLTSLERMDEMIGEALELARQGEDIDDEDRRQVELSPVARSAWETSQTATASLEIDTGATTLYADESRLQRLLENLFRNSVDHGPDDVTVTVGAVDDGFYVADDGPGIPPEERASVFEQGFTTASDGTGLGLSIVASIARAHGWEAAATESAAGGARFEITGTDLTPGSRRDPPGVTVTPRESP